MPNKCCVRGCTVRSGGGHRFPREEDRKKQWLIAIRRKNYKPTANSRVCKKHFTAQDYSLPKDSVIENPLLILNKEAVPSVFSYTDKDYDDGEEKQNRRKRKKEKEKRERIRQKVVSVPINPVLKVPEITLKRVPNDPSLIARLEAARKALAMKHKVSNVDHIGMRTRSESTRFKPNSTSFKCLAYDSPHLKRPTNTESKPSPNLGRTRYQKKNNNSNIQINSNELYKAGQSPYTVPINIQDIKIEKDIEDETVFTQSLVDTNCVDPLYIGTSLSRENNSAEDCLMTVEEIKTEESFLALECVEIEFESQFKDKEIQCDLGDPCCGISLRKEPQRIEYDSFSLKNFKKRRISV